MERHNVNSNYDSNNHNKNNSKQQQRLLFVLKTEFMYSFAEEKEKVLSLETVWLFLPSTTE